MVTLSNWTTNLLVCRLNLSALLIQILVFLLWMAIVHKTTVKERNMFVFSEPKEEEGMFISWKDSEIWVEYKVSIHFKWYKWNNGKEIRQMNMLVFSIKIKSIWQNIISRESARCKEGKQRALLTYNCFHWPNGLDEDYVSSASP